MPALNPEIGSLLSVDIRKRRSVRGDADQTVSRGDADGLVAFWEQARRDRPMPSRDDLDDRRVAFYWPFSILFKRTGRDAADVEKIYGTEQASRAYLGQSLPVVPDDLTVLLKWIYDAAKPVFRKGRGRRLVEYFYVKGTPARLEFLFLPFADSGDDAGYVLVYIQKSTSSSNS